MQQTKKLDEVCAMLVRRIDLYGIPIAALARLSGVARNTIYGLMNGRNISMTALKKVAIGITQWCDLNGRARKGVI